MRKPFPPDAMPGSLIRSVILDGSAALLRAQGQRPALLARRAGLPAAALDDPDLLVPASAVLRYFELAAAAAALPDFGLRLARGARLAALIGPLWVLLRNARTVRQMCAELADNFDLYSDAALITLQPVPGAGGAMQLAWTTTHRQDGHDVQMAEFSMSVLTAELRSHLPRDWQPQAALFRHARPAGALPLHHAAFGDSLRFNQDVNALQLDAATLDAPLQARGAAARALASRLVRLGANGQPRQLAHSVEAVIRSLMPYAPCTVGEVAGALDLAPRTLQLHLTREGTSFSQLRDAVRADLAAKFLHDSTLGAARIAEILGYADPTSFSRAFRRWNGQPLRALRPPRSALGKGNAP